MLAVAKSLGATVSAASETELSALCSASDGAESAQGTQATPGAALPAFAACREGEEGPAASQLQLAAFTWGYNAPWDGKLVYNARIENASSPMWAESFSQRRALVAAAAFFEPHATETQRSPRTGRMGKRPYEFRSLDGAPLLLGAVHEAGRLSIVTTEPNASVAPVHNRMPLVVACAEAPVWLGAQWRSLADRSRIELDVAPEHPDAESFEQLSLFT